ncbi:hypothetical protein D9756_000402 [Leucocoprinus leucothites]|uniref:Yeast cell wall synthesis Kre9/Knh1-like N-terminal domain-containing protein n=1 Tax=Leucocoprinus leucothites TaxID=201217 RepID=A0A8H5GGI7_9AGAR|nr:hypothetical protein D9756_000402 [Leucoagaricus leucothites]
MHAVSVLLALAASACAYQVNQPNGVKGWTNVGPQPVTWTRVNTDPSNFTIVLTNQNRAIFPQDQVLTAQQDGVVTDTVNCNPPSAGWPLGKSFRINFVKSTEEQNTIYAQSNEFEIATPNVTSSGVSTTPIVATPVAVPPPSSTNSPTGTGGSDSPPDPNGAAAIMASSGLMAILGAAVILGA